MNGSIEVQGSYVLNKNMRIASDQVLAQKDIAGRKRLRSGTEADHPIASS
jgi:hypothetical protein